MTNSVNIGDLKPSVLAAKLGVSRSYAHELINGVGKGDSRVMKAPSLKLAVEIEREFGVPASAWLEREAQGAA